MSQLKAGKKASSEYLDCMRSFLRTPEGEGLLKLLGIEQIGIRTIKKRGIQIEGDWFISSEMEDYIGQSIQVRLDPNDTNRIYVFSTDGEEFIWIAECPERVAHPKI